MKIVVPMAGRGRRFLDQGYETPKPLIEVAGRPMLLWALEGLMDMDFSQLILVVLAEHEAQFGVSEMVARHFSKRLGLAENALQVITIPDVTEGQLCTVLAAKSLIDNSEDVLVAASDTFIKSNLAKDILAKPADCAGIISVVDLPGEQWSFACTDETGRVVEVAEKRRISNHASNGLYYFSKGSDLVLWGEEMMRRDERTRGEFYVIPVYQKLIESGRFIRISHASEVWDLGTPEAKSQFEAHFKK
jgi:NDP-sugar pyrophosphorylase family protein